MSQKYKEIIEFKKDSVYILSKGTSHWVSAWTGCGGLGHVERIAQKMPKKPGQLQLRQQGALSPTSVYQKSSVQESSSRHSPALLLPSPHPPHSSSFTSLRLKCLTHFSFCALCLTDVGEWSLWWCCAGKTSRYVPEVLMFSNSGSTSVWIQHLKNISRMYAHFFWKLFIHII